MRVFVLFKSFPRLHGLAVVQHKLPHQVMKLKLTHWNSAPSIESLAGLLGLVAVTGLHDQPPFPP